MSEVADAELSARGLDPADPYIGRGSGLDGWLIIERDWYRNVDLAS